MSIFAVRLGEQLQQAAYMRSHSLPHLIRSSRPTRRKVVDEPDPPEELGGLDQLEPVDELEPSEAESFLDVDPNGLRLVSRFGAPVVMFLLPPKSLRQAIVTN